MYWKQEVCQFQMLVSRKSIFFLNINSLQLQILLEKLLVFGLETPQLSSQRAHYPLR